MDPSKRRKISKKVEVKQEAPAQKKPTDMSKLVDLVQGDAFKNFDFTTAENEIQQLYDHLDIELKQSE